MKVGRKNSKKEAPELFEFYEFLLEPFRFGKFENFKKEVFEPELLERAIEKLSEKEASIIRSVVFENKNLNQNQKAIYWAGVKRLRSLEFRAIYDYHIIQKLQRAEDYESYEPSVVLGFVRLYDDFRTQNSPSNFNIARIESFLKISSFKNLLYLNYGLLDGKSFELKKVALILNLRLDECRRLKEESLQLLKVFYC